MQKDSPYGVERVKNCPIDIGVVYSAWGKSYDNNSLPAFLEERLGHPMPENENLNLSELGFLNRLYVPLDLSSQERAQVELEIRKIFLKETIIACDWKSSDVEAVPMGMTVPLLGDYLNQISKAAGVPENLREKEILAGGIEGLSRFVNSSHDINALQLFGNVGGMIGVIPGQIIKFLAGKSRDVYAGEGMLQVKMYYPHSRQRSAGGTNIDVTEPSVNNIRVAGFMHGTQGWINVVMTGRMGMAKLFVRTRVQVVLGVYGLHRSRLGGLGMNEKSLAVAIVHHANYKTNKLKQNQLRGEEISPPMSWLLNEFGNVSATSNMIAFLYQFPKLKPLDHILIDGFEMGIY